MSTPSDSESTMADQPRKPRNIKDLKARLGRTVQPDEQKGGGAVPPPNLGGAAAAPGVTPPPGVVRPPNLGGAAHAGLGPGLAPPPFMRGPEAPAQPRRPSSPPDPFAAAAPVAVGPREVRLVDDGRPVEDSEVGRKKRMFGLLVFAGGLLGGLLVGGAFMNTYADNRLFSQAVQDGKDIYQAVDSATETVDKAKRFLESAVTSAKGGAGKTPAVDYQAIEALRALEKPFAADMFARKRYRAFAPATVDALFEYYNSVNMLWAKFETLAAKTLPERRRELLAQSAKAAGEMASTPTGCVPMNIEGQLLCGLVYVRVPEEAPEGDAAQKVQVSTQLGGREYEKEIYAAQDLSESPDNYVILTHTQRSLGVLGQQASVFAEYQRDLLELKALMDRTQEVQGRLMQGLSEIASLE